MKQNTLSAEGFESTYALLVRSEEKERGMFEGAAYLVFILSAVFSIWNVAQQPVALPKGRRDPHHVGRAIHGYASRLNSPSDKKGKRRRLFIVKDRSTRFAFIFLNPDRTAGASHPVKMKRAASLPLLFV